MSDKTDEDKDQMANVDPEYIRKEKESFSVTVEVLGSSPALKPPPSKACSIPSLAPT